MKHIELILLSLFFAPLCHAQTLPQNPAPATPDPAWAGLQSLLRDQPIVVENVNGPPLHCLFRAVSDEYLFCSPLGNPAAASYRLNHADVLRVDLDLPPTNQVQVHRTEQNYHPVWISSMIAGGILTGLAASKTTNAGSAAEAGLIGAVVVGAIGAPMAFLPHSNAAFGGPIYSQFGIGIPLSRFAGLHPHRLFSPHIFH